MLDLDKNWVDDRAMKKSGTSEVKKYVMSLVRHTELERILNKKSFKNAKIALDNAHISIDVMNCKDEIVYQVLGRNKAEKFIKDRDELNALYEICSELPTINDFASLSITDQVHIILIAHTICKQIVFTNNIFDVSKGGYEIPFQKIYNNYNGYLYGRKNRKEILRYLREVLRSFMRRLLGNDGKYFYPIKIGRSNFSVMKLSCFLVILHRDWNKNSPVNVFTDLCAVLLYGEDAHYEVINKDAQEDTIEPMQIGCKDFVIRCNIFKCMHELHEIKNIVAIISIVDDDGKIQTAKISAGFCPECNIYFILESTYKDLKTKGTIMCRVTDTKNYAKNGYMNGQKLAKESVLMQYGYTVSRIEGLSDKNRQRLLAVIIDNNILTKSEVIGYLDFFINQRCPIDNMQNAIAKWKKDRQFVENYKNDEYVQIGVNSISRR